MKRDVYDRISGLITEAINPKTTGLDTMPVEEILLLMNKEDRQAVEVVESVIPQIEKVVGLVVGALRSGGRLFYVGAGTSGRLGVLDAAECPPTFGTDPEMVQGIIAGGHGALVEAVEGSEDDEMGGAQELEKRGLQENDVVIGIAASTRTPFVMGALKYARKLGIKTVLVTCNKTITNNNIVDYIIEPVVGPEVVTGSTRLKAGTATKIVLNMITTASMVRMGKVWGNLMVDLQAWSDKLKARSCRILTMTTGCTFEDAVEVLNKADGDLKTAIVMNVLGVDIDRAKKLLLANNGKVRGALGGIGPELKE